MPQTSSLTHAPQTLWEAVGQLAEIQTQEKIALDNGDIGLFQRLLEQQAQAWQVVCTHAAELIATRRVPEDMIQRLQQRLNIHRDHERRLQQAKDEIRQKLEKLQDQQQATQTYKAQQQPKLVA